MPTSRIITRQAEVTTPLDLRVRVANGRVRINGGEGRVATVNVAITVLGGWKEPDDEDVERVAEGIIFTDEGLFIESPDNDGPFRRRGLKLEYEIEVPRETRVDLSCANGPIGVSNLVGPVGMRVANGPVTIEDVERAIELHLANGPVKLTRCGAAIEASVVNGPLRITEVAGPVTLGVTNGPIHLEKAAGAVEAKAVNGPVHFLGPVRGNLELTTQTGAITLKLPADSRFQLDAESERGSVRSDFRVSDVLQGPADAYRLVLRTHNGDIRLQQEGSGPRLFAGVDARV